ncbi:hypothetical protein KIPB_008221 [Kipferlia bialata]|uniref:Uracil-DNA glycosylase-like domain-containing protein n=1 Tax=Kipferlia bialata TaxID=797122 RepID=A0A9K3D174_9EUKA|nr:hypothetical protein KIPB_008221 [Kipferlia bialata]|eukprot:g8221.t1
MPAVLMKEDTVVTDDSVVDSLMSLLGVKEEWRGCISVLAQQPNLTSYVSVQAKRQGTIPSPECILTPLRVLRPQDVRMLVFGQDPYPRPASAVGIAFCDGEVRSWDMRLSPSLRNIIKDVLISADHADPKTKVGPLRTKLAEMRVPSPQEWFHSTQAQGVLWLNTALTFSGKDAPTLAKHIAFWRPFVDAVIQTTVAARAEAGKAEVEGSGLVTLMWGGKALKLKPVVEAAAEKTGCRVVYVERRHPAVEAFHQNNTFRGVRAAFDELGMAQIDWVRPDSGEGEGEGTEGDIEAERKIKSLDAFSLISNK